MSLKVGIVGLPNVGKSTLFNALLKKQQAYAANFPFATIEPNVGIVPVPDSRLERLADVVEAEQLSPSTGHAMTALRISRPPVVPALVQFVDIAGLVTGAHKGEGLGNKFLSYIREVDAIVHVVRGFSDENVIRSGSVSPKEDLQTIETELALADLETIEKQREPKGSAPKEELVRWNAVTKIRAMLAEGNAARNAVLTQDEQIAGKALSLLTMKPHLVVVNVDEEHLRDSARIEEQHAKEFGLSTDRVIAICARTESELAGLSEEDAQMYLADLGVTQSGLERLIKKAFATLGLITFLTAGVKEVRAWTIKDGTDAQHAAGEIHTDFISKFIKAEVVSFEDFVEAGGPASPDEPSASRGGWKKSREQGKARLEGREYVMRDGDVVEFKIGS